MSSKFVNATLTLHQRIENWEQLIDEVNDGIYENEKTHLINISLIQLLAWKIKQVLYGLQQDENGNPIIIKYLLDEYDLAFEKMMHILSQIPNEKIMDLLLKDIERKLMKYEKRVTIVHKTEFEVNLDTLQVRDSIEYLLQRLSDKIDTNSFSQRAIEADRVLKKNYTQNPKKFDSFTISFRERMYKPKEQWWWYMEAT